MLFEITFSVAIIALLFYWFLNKFTYWERKGFPYIEPHIPFGSFKDVGVKIHVLRRLQEFYEEYKEKTKVVGLYFFARPVLLVTNLDVAKAVMMTDSFNFLERGNYSNKEADPLSANLVNLDGEPWKKMRAKMVPAFTSLKLKTMFKTYLAKADHLVDFLKKQTLSEVEVKDLFSRYLIDVITKFAFGLEANAMTDQDSLFVKYGRKTFEPNRFRFAKVMLMSTFPNLSRRLGLRELQKDISDFFLDSIRQTIAHREKTNAKRNDFLCQMIELMKLEKSSHQSASENITIEEVAAQAFIFFFGRTTSSAISFTLYELALNPKIQQRLREDIKETLSRHNNELTYEALQDMKYLQMCVNETLRMYPPIESLARKASQDYKIPGTDLTIEKGTTVLVPMFSIHYDEKIYPDPLKYDPERFSEENKRNRHSMAHFPFGGGPRTCIGKRLAFMTTQSTLVRLLTTFRISTTPNTIIPMDFDPSKIFLSPLNETILLKFEIL